MANLFFDLVRKKEILNKQLIGICSKKTVIKKIECFDECQNIAVALRQSHA